MTYLLENVKDSRVGLLQGRGKKLQCMLDMISRLEFHPLRVSYTFCCESGLDEDTPRTRGTDLATRARGEATTAGRTLPRERRARRPQRARDMVTKKVKRRINGTHNSCFDREAAALILRSAGRSFPVARGKRKTTLDPFWFTAWSVHGCFPYLVARQNSSRLFFLLFTQLNPR